MSVRPDEIERRASSANEKALLSALVIFGGGLAVMLVCAVVGAGSMASVLLGLLAMVVVWRALK